jgi:hypothetical protein
MIGAVAARLAGSADIYQSSGHLPINSVNFVTCHDGFTLNDLVSYNDKHNEANGEGNRDGINDNLSWNCGQEGPTDDPAIEALREFLNNHIGCLASIDFFVVPTVTFRLLYGFVILLHERRRVTHFNVTTHPSAQWVARQLRQAFPFDQAPRYLIRDRDGVYGEEVRQVLKGLGIEEVLIAPRSPWQNPYCERLIGTIRRDLLDHVMSSGSGTCCGCCRAFSTTIITTGAVTRRSTATRRTGVRSRRRTEARSQRRPSSAGYTIATGAPREDRLSTIQAVPFAPFAGKAPDCGKTSGAWPIHCRARSAWPKANCGPGLSLTPVLRARPHHSASRVKVPAMQLLLSSGKHR